MAERNLQTPRGLGPIDGTMPEWQAQVERYPIADFVDYNLRGIGQVVFMNNSITGLAILVAMFWASWWLGFAGALGVVVSTITGILLGYDRSAIRAGLYGFNGVLVGAALATFLGDTWDLAVMGYIVAIAAFSSVLMGALAKIFLTAWAVPPFTLPFNFATLIFFFGALSFANVTFGGLINPRVPAVGSEVTTGLRSSATASASYSIENLANAIFRGIGQLFFANDLWSGVLIIAGILVASRIAAGFALVGSIFGMLTGLAIGADGFDIYNGLWGFNSFDAALAIGGVFFVLTYRSALYAVACAIATALLFGAIAQVFSPWGMPALTLPFCFGTLAFVLVKGLSAKLTPVEVADITTPEEHLRLARGRGPAPART